LDAADIEEITRQRDKKWDKIRREWVK